jgi:hypothetical protein
LSRSDDCEHMQILVRLHTYYLVRKRGQTKAPSADARD